MTALALMTDDEVATYGRRFDTPEAGCGALQTARGALPLVALRLRARVTGVIAATEIVQTFANTTGEAIEATYIFPLPDRAAVHRFRMEAGGRVIEGLVEERGAAREQYAQAIERGQRAAIAEEERSGVFTMRVGNIMPGERATVTLSLVGPLPIDDGEVTLRFPLVVAPRYVPGSALGGAAAGLGTAADTDVVPDASRISPPVRLPGTPNPVQLALEVAFDDAVRDLASSLHAVHESDRAVRVEPGERLDRDFILRWRIAEQELASSLVCVDDVSGKAGTFVLTLVPPSSQTLAQKPRDVVFVVDRSGSMAGWKMIAARRAVGRMIDTLSARDRFCVLAFDDHVESIPAALADATDRTRFRAVEQLARIDARGGTELAQPLLQAVGMLAGGYEDRERVIVLATDGQVGNEDHILRELGPRMRNVRMFTLGIDKAVNAGFLQRLAAAGAGMCELVESEDRLDAVMAKFHRRIGAPIASELALRPTGLELDRGALAPSRVPDVYAGAPVVVFGRYRGAAPPAAAIELEGTSFGDSFRAKVAAAPRSGPNARAAGVAGWLGACWARAHLRDLEDRYSMGELHLEAEIVAVSRQFQVLSRFTAFVAIDRSDAVNPGGRVTSVVQPVEPPAEWSEPTGAFKVAAPGAVPGALARRGGIEQSRAQSGPMQTTLSAMYSPPAADDSSLDLFDDAQDLSRAPSPAPMKKSDVHAHNFAPRSIAPSPPPPPSSVPRGRSAIPAAPRSGTKAEESSVEPLSPAPYLAKLAALAEALGRETAPLALRVLRQRLTEWVEDARSVGLGKLATDVERIVRPLGATLDVPTAQAVAAELVPIAQGRASKRGLAFWK